MIANQTHDSAELLVFGDIGDDFMGGITAKAFHQELLSLGDMKNITVKINSGGGLAFDGIAMMNSIKAHPAKVTAEVMGLAASAASIVAMGADEIVMRKGSMMMVHLPFGLVLGNASDMRKQATILDQMTNELVAIYKTKTRKHANTILRMLEEETWMNGDEAVQNGFADRVVDAPSVKASVDPGRYSHCPADWMTNQSVAAKATIVDPWRSRAARRVESLAE